MNYLCKNILFGKAGSLQTGNVSSITPDFAILTTNRKFEDWEQLFGDKVMASAIIDRLVHHAYIVKITGYSYRVKNAAMPENK